MNNKKILLVDDTPEILEIVKIKLEQNGFMVDTANNGKEAIEKIKFNNYDLIILDVMMPEMDGIETALEIMKINSNAKFIFFTNYGEDNPLIGKEIDEYYAKQIGASAFFRKTDDLNKIIEKINQLLS
ncbi:MAG: two-component system response regulator [Candidatus Parcubacteria bacterium]|nr:MAG: two-component system response regulator [Candidatus Parcubacteria bacterium]